MDCILQCIQVQLFVYVNKSRTKKINKQLNLNVLHHNAIIFLKTRSKTVNNTNYDTGGIARPIRSNEIIDKYIYLTGTTRCLQ